MSHLENVSPRISWSPCGQRYSSLNTLKASLSELDRFPANSVFNELAILLFSAIIVVKWLLCCC